MTKPENRRRRAEPLAPDGPPSEFEISRRLDATPDVVFRTLTESRHVALWWGPDGFTAPVCELDARVGGSIRIHMQGPDQTLYPPMLGTFVEVVPPERLVYETAVVDPDGRALFAHRVTFTLAAEGSATRLTVRVRLLRALPEAALYLGGARQGWAEQIARLGAYAAGATTASPP